MNSRFLEERNTLHRSGFFTKTTWTTRCSKTGTLISTCHNVNIEVKAKTMSIIREKQIISLESIEIGLVDAFILRKGDMKYLMEVI
jgi:hypothetical protein